VSPQATTGATPGPEATAAAARAIGLYVHLPWCVRKCPYCDFNSHPLVGEIPEGAYVDALLADLDRDLTRPPEQTAEVVLASVFLGGGTPSLLSARAVGRLLDGVVRRAGVAPDCEVTLEANPGAADVRRFRGYRRAGVNRLSIGAQSFDDRLLAAIGRVHGAREALAALDAAAAAGFDDVNVDLMYGLPGQDVAGAARDVTLALSRAPAHVSRYELTLEPGTRFHRHPPELPGEDAVWAMHLAGAERLARAGYERYEISAWARAGARDARSRHNLGYWRFGDYLGIGAGAHGKRTRRARDGRPVTVERRVKWRGPRRYLRAADDAAFTEQRLAVEARDLPAEYMMNALRIAEGFGVADFEGATGLGWHAVAPVVGRALRDGLLERRGGRFRASARGWQYLDGLVARFVAPAPRRARCDGGRDAARR